MNMMLNGSKHNSVSAVAKKTAVRYTEPTPVEKLNWLIHLQHVRGETAACKDLIRAEIENCGGRNEFLFYKQGSLLRDEGNIGEALESFQICLKLNPDNTENIKAVAACLYDLRRYRLALDAYKEAERISDTPDWQIFHRIAESMLVLGDVEGAKNYVKKAVQHGKNETSYSLLVKMLKNEGDFKSALAGCRSAIESCPDSVDMLCEAGFLHLKLGENQQAFERLSDALALNPYCSKALLGIGCITQSHGEVDVALSKYKTAIQYEPNSVALWNNIGTCFHTKQKHIAAISCLKRALWISPLNWRVLFNLGLVHLSINQPASAFNFLCAAVNLRPDVAQSFSTLGYSLMELQDPENALQAFDQAANLAPLEMGNLLSAALCSACAGLCDKFRTYLLAAEGLMNVTDNVPKECTELYQQLSNIPLADVVSLSSKERAEMKPHPDSPVDNIRNSTSKEIFEPKKSNENSGDPDRKMGPDEV